MKRKAPRSANSQARSVLALNLGSAGLKAASYSCTPDFGTRHTSALETGRMSLATRHDDVASPDENANTLLAAAAQGLPSLRDLPDVVAHRIVHGADRPGPVPLTAETIAQLQALSSLAPLHQAPALALVQAAIRRWPDAWQVAVFDTSWHQTMPEQYRLLSIPYELYLRGVKRYGFHGLAFQSAMRQLAGIAPEIARGRVVLAHLGGGSSLCAVLDGVCLNTTMGMTPLGGLTMATRSGSLDPGVLLHLQGSLGMSLDRIEQLLWRESGLLGLSNESGDMRELLASNSEGARRAVDVYVSGVAEGIAAMAACLRGVDALVFSGGVGSHSAEIRARVTDALGWAGIVIDPYLNLIDATEISSSTAAARTFVFSADEESEMVAAISI